MRERAIKVLHLISSLASGGAERQLVNLVSSASKDNVEHVVCVIDEADFFGPAVSKSGCKLIELKISSKHPFFRAAMSFRRVIDHESPDILHSWLYDANISARLATLPLRTLPIITSLQLPDYEPEAARISNWDPRKVRALKAIDKFTASITRTHFVACSEFVRSSYRQHYGIAADKIEVIYNSVDPHHLECADDDVEDLRRELGLPPDAFVYLNVGRLDPQKNHPLMLEAFSRALHEVPNGYLLLVGAGPILDGLSALAQELEISERVLFLGRRHDIGALLELSDVFVFPSAFEGLGVALVEAMFKSRPSIASRIDVLEEIIADGENGLLIDQTSPGELANAMVKIYKEPALRQSLATNALRTAEIKFSVGVTTTHWERLYERIFNKSRI